MSINAESRANEPGNLKISEHDNGIISSDQLPTYYEKSGNQ